ncbi:MAG: hypothetical protein WA019_02565 [Candidatus Moraniibacteriota bacterium]
MEDVLWTIGLRIIPAMSFAYAIHRASKADEVVKRSIPYLIFSIVFFAAIINYYTGKKEVNNSLKAEINQMQIPIKGEVYFNSTIRITYKDGEFDSIVLVPGTTRGGVK